MQNECVTLNLFLFGLVTNANLKKEVTQGQYASAFSVEPEIMFLVGCIIFLVGCVGVCLVGCLGVSELIIHVGVHLLSWLCRGVGKENFALFM